MRQVFCPELREGSPPVEQTVNMDQGHEIGPCRPSGLWGVFLFFFPFNPDPRTCLMIWERQEGREKERERNIDWLPLTCVLCAGD